MAGATPGGPQDRVACTPCRGTGRVVSRLGGTEHEVVCPWCGGTGRFVPGRDAQAEPAERAARPGADAGGGGNGGEDTTDGDGAARR
jgi:DnaJ-class molecular chaperone